MAKRKAGRGAAFDSEGAAVDGAVMGRAERDEVLGGVGAAVVFSVDVVDVDEGRVAAAGDTAATAVAVVNETANGRRDGLRSTCVTHVGVRVVRRDSHGRRVTFRRLHDVALDVEGVSLRQRASPAAVFANVESHLVARVPRVGRAAEDVARHQ